MVVEDKGRMQRYLIGTIGAHHKLQIQENDVSKMIWGGVFFIPIVGDPKAQTIKVSKDKVRLSSEVGVINNYLDSNLIGTFCLERGIPTYYTLHVSQVILNFFFILGTKSPLILTCFAAQKPVTRTLWSLNLFSLFLFFRLLFFSPTLSFPFPSLLFAQLLFDISL